MAYPTIYNVTYSYTGFQQSQGNNAFPGTQIDADFAGLRGSVSNLALFVQGVLRSDGLLNNNLVTFDSLSPSLQTAGLAPAVTWLTGTTYAVGNNVVTNNNLYRALTSHTSGVFATDLAAGKWVLVSALPGYGGTSATSFLIGLGVKVFAVQGGAAYVVGSRVRLASNANPVNYMEGLVTASNGAALTVNVTRFGGAGTFADWNLTVAGDPGSGDLLSTNNLADVAAPATALVNLGGVSFAAQTLTTPQQVQVRQNIGVDTGQCEMIINKGVAIDQTWEGGVAYADGSNNPHPGAARTTETYGPDNWRIGADSGTGNFYGQRVVGAMAPGLRYNLQATVTTADASATATNNYHIEIPIEGPRLAQSMIGTPSAQPITVQFWFASGTAGTFALTLCEGTNNSLSCTKTFVYNGSTAPQQYVLTFPACTTGTWSYAPGAIGAKLLWDLGMGSNFETTTPGVWQGFAMRTAACVRLISTLSATVNITGVQADVGSIALPYRFVDPGQDLLDCQRFYFKTFPIGVAVAQNAGYVSSLGYIAQIAAAAAGYGIPVRYPVSMPNAPTITTFNPAAANNKWRNQSLNADSAAPSVFNGGNSGCILYSPQIAGDVAGAILNIHMVANGRLGGAF